MEKLKIFQTGDRGNAKVTAGQEREAGWLAVRGAAAWSTLQFLGMSALRPGTVQGRTAESLASDKE